MEDSTVQVVVSGSTGLVGRALCEELLKSGHTVRPLVRDTSSAPAGSIPWDPARDQLDGAALDGVDAVVHLAGEPIAAGRWNAARKARIRDSRVAGTQLLAERLAGLSQRPGVLVSASAIGFYGDQGDAVVTEDTPAGQGFLAEVCQGWEAAAAPAADAGIRVVHPRIGMVLSERGGALSKMLPPFRMGMGGPIGRGAMWMSWIHLEDLVRALIHMIETPELAGPVNALAPNPVTNRDFTRALGSVLRRPAVIPVPETALKFALGEMAEELVLSSLRAVPSRLEGSGFAFKFPEVEAALRDLLSGSEAKA
ncbi:MAG: TIGR01777 family oxidoreductase [Candidatus Hydrogenedentes bacterium]|nr:TIGR01777 family oxidoreductase [Candidatus Hydrogenedentota bacterium]